MKRFSMLVAMAIVLSLSLSAQVHPAPDSARTDISLTGFYDAAYSKARLNWTCSQNENIASFYIQRSNDGVHFKVIALFFSNENKGNETYNYNERHSGKAYYRLIARNADGTELVSNSICVQPTAIPAANQLIP